ncbi:MAG: diaminopimelate epimerase [Mariniphaga sp.]|jgi:diaminopimelate epimerase|nr:diaminopimelate epimerase [Mariniphaga sp.]
MMTTFYKFHGAGNDFIMIDGRLHPEIPAPSTIAKWCSRRTGIGADGLMVLKPVAGFDFEMVYYNADGSKADMCGNGARCSVAFAFMSGLCGKACRFMAGDGPHTGRIIEAGERCWMVEVSLVDVKLPENPDAIINTGNPHLVIVTEDTNAIDVVSEGRRIRFSPPYAEQGVNVNWMSIHEDHLWVRTYERGVEDETLSCGTGITASAIKAALFTGKNEWKIETRGGKLHVRMQRNAQVFNDISLGGPAVMVFKGELKRDEA